MSQPSPERILVASTNPVKIQAALGGFQQMFPHRSFVATGESISSGVSDQPMSDAETLLGATNRAKRARELQPDVDFAVGIEGGIDRVAGQMFASAWIVVHTPQRVGQARSGLFPLPPRVQQLVDGGTELGLANDIVFAESNSKRHGGAIGSLTAGVIDRQRLYEHAMVLALVPFQRLDLFPAQAVVAKADFSG